MRVAQLVPGSGGTFYCENCVRDFALVRALRKRGLEMTLVPMYLPFLPESRAEENAPLFFGGIATYLQQTVPLFRRTPPWVDRLLDAPWLLRLASRRAGSTRSSALGEMTLSMLRGEEGNQAKEFRRLAVWLSREVRPEVIHLSNALLLGLARPLRRATGAAIVCSLQDEAPWVDAMGEPHAGRCWQAMRERAAEVDAFVSVSRSYADVMAGRLGVQGGRMRVVPLGVDPAEYPPAPLGFSPPAIGFLARMSEGNGLEALVDAYVRLRGTPGLERLRLRISGGKTGDDEPFLARIRRRLSAGEALGGADFVEGFSLPERVEFLRSLTVFSVPGSDRTASGLGVLEAMAAGVPVVQPRHGSFPELVEATGGGTLYDPAKPGAIAEALSELLRDPDRARLLGRRGREGVASLFTIDGMAEKTASIYRSVRDAASR
jgi:glycosyltransferase involved in cell wall biosynthesis